MSKKNVIIVVVCLVVIVAAVFSIFGKGVLKSGPPRPAPQPTVRCVIVGPPPDGGEVVEVLLGDWDKLEIVDADKGYRKYEGYTVARAMDCPHCGKAIPRPAGEPPFKFKCPECGKEVDQD